ITCTFPALSRAGDLIVVAGRWAFTDVTTGTISDDKGSAYASAIGPIDSGIAGHAGGQIWYLANAKGGIKTVTLTWSGLTGGQIACHEYSGLAVNSVLDQATYTIGSGVNLNSGNVTTTFPNEMLFGWGVVASNDRGSFSAGT